MLAAFACEFALVRDVKLPANFSFLRGFVPDIHQINWTLYALIIGFLGLGIAVACGIYIRLRATTVQATEQASVQKERTQQLQANLSNQQVADAIAVEAHDTLAHSLSLIGLNASALKVEADKLQNHPDNLTQLNSQTYAQAAHDIALRAEDIRKQAAGALDETHSVIDMLRHPDEVMKEMQPDPQTALTRPALEDIIRQSRGSGMKLDTWIDVENLSQLDPPIGKVAYRVIQEGLTNARRHAPGQPISLEVTARPDAGIHVHLSNPMPPTQAIDQATTPIHLSTSEDAGQNTLPAMPNNSFIGATPAQNNQANKRLGGNGLKGLTARTASFGGHCAFGVDNHDLFNLDVTLPFVLVSSSQQPYNS
ncbi:hypothetical protein KIMH_13450 [Bombiscardovia apis]|uniref:histidine kinase n=2 Tax=Bombiscardovia apis TaxID=2932182 RepID=A0ABM8BEB1_9BIFI|nr:hypothetical protein KIMH_13450 [Bombiscardovia apis]